MNYEVLIKNYHLLTTSSLVVVNDKLQVVYSEPKLEVLPSKLYQAIAIDLKDVDRDIGDPKLVDVPEDFGYIKQPDKHTVIFYSSTGKYTQHEIVQVNAILKNLKCVIKYDVVQNEDLGDDDFDIEVPHDVAKLVKNVAIVHVHNQYRLELALQDAVRSGDVEMLKRAFKIPTTGKDSVLGFDPLRSEQNMSHITNVLCARAAIFAGVPVEAVYRLSDKLFLTVEACKSLYDLKDMRFIIAKSFTLQVNAYHESLQVGKSPKLVSQAVGYIQANLYNKFNLDDLATFLNINKDYLQRIFKKTRGRTIFNYVQYMRVNSAKELLISTNLTIKEVSSLLQFSSPAHFVKVFKDQFGTTPANFRKKYASNPEV